MKLVFFTKLLCAVCVVFLLAGCNAKVLETIPAGGTVRYNEIVYVENDGRCQQGQVIKITGGNNNKGIPRKYDCADRP